ncbi:serine protease family S09X [Phytophthora cinnamomi]|uniref:serine protease family S09X n=1 Tax=Phytophthora cinnamomi TaxID=4785 RepID=UPI00355A2B85|nr:serine protease family S09X [Phytophthora cinnamomi]
MYRRLHRLGGRVRVRAWSSSAKPASSGSAAQTTASASTTVGTSTRSATPGTVRVSKGFGADKHEAELDSTIARIIGSDWGDRSHQPVSLAMRLYWVVFGLVLANGLYTYVAGKDESFLVEKLRKKADEKLGVEEEENEFEEMAAKTVQAAEEKQAPAVPAAASTAAAPATSMLSSGGMAPGMPFMSPGIVSQSGGRHSKTKAELDQQLAQLRLQQERLHKQIRSGEGVMKEELEHQVRMIDVQKDQVKRAIKSL